MSQQPHPTDRRGKYKRAGRPVGALTPTQPPVTARERVGWARAHLRAACEALRDAPADPDRVAAVVARLRSLESAEDVYGAHRDCPVCHTANALTRLDSEERCVDAVVRATAFMKEHALPARHP